MLYCYIEKDKNIVNITEYKNRGDGYKCYYGKATLKKGYSFVDGDEPFYALLGTNSCYSMTELLHPDDPDYFREQ